MKELIIKTIAGMAVLLTASTDSRAQSLPDANVVVGRELQVQSATSRYDIHFGASAFRSFCCTGTADNASVEFIGAGIVQPPQSISATFRGGVDPFVTFQNNPVAAGRICFTTPSNGILGVAATAGGDADTLTNLRVQCDETTLYGGYNVAAADLNFLEIHNTSNADIEVTIRTGDSRTGETNSLFTQITVGASQRADLDIHSNVDTGSFGPMSVTHNGPLGSITANVSQYKVTSTGPLAFELIGKVPFATRVAQ